MNDSKRLTQMIHNSKRFLSDHNRASFDQLVQGGEALEWQPIAKRIFVALLILENVHQNSADDVAYIAGLYATLNHGCDVGLFRQVYLDMPELEAQAKQERVLIDKLAELLDRVEWVGEDVDVDAGPWCEWCGAYQTNGHATTCEQQTILRTYNARKGQAK